MTAIVSYRCVCGRRFEQLPFECCGARVTSASEHGRLRAEVATLRAELMSIHDALHRECDGETDLPAEIRTLRAKADEFDRIMATAKRCECDSLRAALAEATQTERERCARVADDYFSVTNGDPLCDVEAGEDIAAAIRGAE